MDKEKKNLTQNKETTLNRDFSINLLKRIKGEGNERKFRISFSSEEPYERYLGLEILDHSEGCVDLTRLNEIGCVLFNHKRDVVIGKILHAEIKNGRGEAEIEFDTDQESEKIFQKVSSGTLKGVSVGYRVGSWEDVLPNHTSSDGRFKGPASIAKRWMPFEISIVSVPADQTVGVGRELEEVFHQKEQEPATNRLERQIQINKNRNGGLS